MVWSVCRAVDGRGPRPAWGWDVFVREQTARADGRFGVRRGARARRQTPQGMKTGLGRWYVAVGNGTLSVIGAP